jgi:hypothetical protein
MLCLFLILLLKLLLVTCNVAAFFQRIQNQLHNCQKAAVSGTKSIKLSNPYAVRQFFTSVEADRKFFYINIKY